MPWAFSRCFIEEFQGIATVLSAIEKYTCIMTFETEYDKIRHHENSRNGRQKAVSAQ